MPLVPTIIRCCAHIVRLVCGQTDRQTDRQNVLAAHARRGLPIPEINCRDTYFHKGGYSFTIHTSGVGRFFFIGLGLGLGCSAALVNHRSAGI